MSKLPIFGLYLSVGNLEWFFIRFFKSVFSQFFFYRIRSQLACKYMQPDTSPQFILLQIIPCLSVGDCSRTLRFEFDQ